MIYFTSDQHFYHENIIKSVGRPFENAEEMNRILIQNWNENVGPEDEVYILGDISLKRYPAVSAILAQLNGKKYLIKGNHDYFADKANFASNQYFGWMKDLYEFRWAEYSFVLSHYPQVKWHGMEQGAIHLHGHEHNSFEYNLQNKKHRIYRYDVGVDANHMEPVSIEEIVHFFDLKQTKIPKK